MLLPSGDWSRRTGWLPCSGRIARRPAQGFPLPATAGAARTESGEKENDVKDMQERLARLEEDNYFLGKRMEELDEALAAQQKQLDHMEKALAEAAGIIAGLRQGMEELAARGRSAVDEARLEIPPHYGRW